MVHSKVIQLNYIYTTLIFLNCIIHGTSMDLYKNAKLGTRIVQTRYGRLQGIILPLEDYRFLKPLEAFLGVPYATPPTKSNRFAPTRTPNPWNGVRMADKFSSVCPQKLPNILNDTSALEKMPKGRLEYLRRLLPFLKNQSEDCLYLNIFSPAHVSSGKVLPVIIFLHGESFEWNSGNPFDGTVLASYTDTVVVTINYRLGVLGFLNANPNPHLRARVANYGLMDQMAALHWVNQNIGQFGGNPAMVTLAGHGTGAACIDHLMRSPSMVAGLFHRAILLSGSSYSSWATVEDPVVNAVRLAKELNCSIPEDLFKHQEQIIDCLRDVPLETLLAVEYQSPTFLSAFGPSVDGVVIRNGFTAQEMDENIQTRLNSQKHLQSSSFRPYDVLFGVVTGESIWQFSAHDIQNGFEGEKRDRILRTYVRNTYTYHLSEIFHTIVNEYTDWERTNSHPINTRDATIAALSDAQFIAPLVHTGDKFAPPPPIPQQEVLGPKCFFYVFDYQTKDGDYPQRMGTVHGEDLPYIFGAPLVDGFNHFPQNYTKSEVALSEAMMIYWSNFARTGNPNEHHRQDPVLLASRERNRYRSITWEEYDPVHQKYLEVGMKPRMKNHFRAHQLSIWLRLVPELHKTGMEDVVARHNFLKQHDDINSYEGVVRSDPRFIFYDENYKRRLNLTEYIINGISTIEPFQFTTCVPINNFSGFVSTSPNIANSTSDTLSSFETVSYAAYSTALSVTIAIGCSLLILNVLIFAGVYYQRDKTRLEVKSLQKHHLGAQTFDPIKHAHFHFSHPQNANVVVDIEGQNDLFLEKTPHICPNSMQLSANIKSSSPSRTLRSNNSCITTQKLQKPPKIQNTMCIKPNAPMKDKDNENSMYSNNSTLETNTLQKAEPPIQPSNYNRTDIFMTLPKSITTMK